MSKKALNSVIILSVLCAIYTSCANVGMPKGGPKDETPPTVLRSLPVQGQTNSKGKEIRIYFDEFIQMDGLNEKFVVSPPTSKRPVFRTKGKSLVVNLNEELLPNKTYSLDFKDGIADNNEKNPLRDYRLAFSTGPEFDSLRLVGYVKDAFNLEPVPNSYVLLYSGKSDTLVSTTRPDYIAKTDHQGFFALTNIPAKSYQIFAVTDLDNNLKYTSGSDSIAFLDSLVIPSAQYFPQQDTTVSGPDTLVVFGKTRFYPDPLNFLRFGEKYFDLRLDNYLRSNRKYLDLIFTASVEDTFNIEPLNVKPAGDWKLIEKSAKSDSLRIWMTDSLVYNMDTLVFKLSYLQQDSLKNFYTTNDTVRFFFADKQQVEKGKRKERRKIAKEIEEVVLSSSARAGFDIYRDILIESPDPIAKFDSAMVHLQVRKDSLYTPVTYKLRADTANNRKYWISYPWEFATNYKLTIDSMAVTTVYDLPSKKLEAEFKTQEEEHYGKIILSVRNVVFPTIIQLLSDDSKENVIRSTVIEKDGEVTFPYLEPQKYLLKAIVDRNNNGKWDTGNLKEKIQPEEVCYFPSVIKVRSNWDNEGLIWDLPVNQFTKKIVDDELEAEKLKKKKELSRKKSAF